MLAFIQQYFTTVAAALAIMSTAYLIFWVAFGNTLRNRKIQLSKRAGAHQIREEVVATLLSFIGSTVFMLSIVTLKDNGLTKFHAEAGKYGWSYEILTVVVMVLISDTWFYWSHRAMHHAKVYKYVHALHHKSLDVNPYTSTSFHVIEAVLLTVWILPLGMLMPVSMAALGVMQVVGTLNNLKSHLGYELFPGFFTFPPFNMLVTATNHSLHHTQYNGNYGLFFRFWDIVCDTELNTTSSTFAEIHQRHDAEIIDNTTYRTLVIDGLVKENSTTISVYFRPTDKAFYNYHAGQYLTVKVKIDGKTYNRCFSLSSSPNIDNFLRITVKLKGEVSHYFFSDAKAGDTIESLLPVGDFTFRPHTDSVKNYVMVAGGSGITPLFSMIQTVLYTEPDSTVTLLYANKTEANIIFQKELHHLAQHYPHFTYTDFISGKKRIRKEDLSANISPNASYYICGPDTLKGEVAKHLKDMNIQKSHIHIENFADGYIPWFGLFQGKPTIKA
ncbi:MAG: hypothetical protein EAZ92_12355 [Candidatus Kapaibacterium sp.]|nr:MAG: hypothetical protein EAZ92_12355 [Candidatus Kapabacteria bacterium]